VGKQVTACVKQQHELTALPWKLQARFLLTHGKSKIMYSLVMWQQRGN